MCVGGGSVSVCGAAAVLGACRLARFASLVPGCGRFGLLRPILHLAGCVRRDRRLWPRSRRPPRGADYPSTAERRPTRPLTHALAHSEAPGAAGLLRARAIRVVWAELNLAPHVRGALLAALDGAARAGYWHCSPDG